MKRADHRLATVLTLAAGILWGFYWLPVRRLEETGLAGGWGTLAIVATAALTLLPIAVWQGRALLAADRRALAFVALGGASFVLYSTAIVYGRVVLVILLFFLTPVWSVLIGRLALGWPTSRLRLAAICVGLVGLAVMLGADGTVPRPEGLGEWMALASGFLWAVATTGMKVRPETPPLLASFVFALGAVAAALVLAPLLEPAPRVAVADLAWAVPAGVLWWAICLTGLMWATTRLDPPRVGILLMSEVLVGTISAAWLAGEAVGPVEMLGGTLVLAAGVLEVWPTRRVRAAA